MVQEEIAALGHTEEALEAVDPTCTATGLTAGVKCSACGEILTAQTEVAALGHTEVIDKAVAATCEATGLTEGKHCSVCNAVLEEQTVVAALGHSYEAAVTKAATCTEAGVRTYTCKNDKNHTYTEKIVATGHTSAAAVVENNVDPDCLNAGSYDSVVY